MTLTKKIAVFHYTGWAFIVMPIITVWVITSAFEAVACLAFLFALAWIIGKARVRLSAENVIAGETSRELAIPRPGSATLFLALIFTLYQIVLLYISQSTPLFAWDGLSYWAHSASNVLSVDLPLKEKMTEFAAQHEERHPPAIILIAVLISDIVGQIKFLPLSSFHYSAFLIMANASMLLAYAMQLGKLAMPQLILLLTVSSAPFIENTYQLVGYAEPALFSAIFALLLCAHRAAAVRTTFARMSVLVSLAAVIQIKNTGVLIAFAFLAQAAIVAFLSARIVNWKKGFVVILFFFAAAFLLVYGFSFDATGSGAWWTGKALIWQPEERTMFFLGYNLRLTMDGIHGALISSFHAVFLNSSFSIIWILFCFCFFSDLPCLRIHQDGENLSLNFLLIMLAIICSGFFVEMFYRTALPHQDTRFTRILLLTAAPLTLYALKVVSRKNMTLERTQSAYVN